MKCKIVALLLALSLLLTGCSWLDGNYVSVTPHREQRHEGLMQIVSASKLQELLEALKDMVSAGQKSAVINVAEYPAGHLETGMDLAISLVCTNDPIGAYAVEEINYEIGTNNGIAAVAIDISYRHSSMELRAIRRVADMTAATRAVSQALDSYSAGTVLLVEEFENMDFSQLVQDYARTHPEKVMEIPHVTAGVYGADSARVVELTFVYQNSRDALRQMQAQVQPVFNAAALYVSGDGAQRQKYSQLYAFLMERFDYTLETSITPAYSLLRHGVGDSRAFATVYASMCRAAGLESIVVTGTRDGEPWTWNIVLDDGHYYHVDLLRCSSTGGFREKTDGEMGGYVWDFSAYPACPEVVIPEPTSQTPAKQESEGEPEETAAETTVPELTEAVENTEENIF